MDVVVFSEMHRRSPRYALNFIVREASIIARLQRAIPSHAGRRDERAVPLGIGDDAAVVRASRALDWVVSTDAFVEGAHFLARLHPARSIGYKALARATSDLAAMGATPRWFLLTLSLPTRRAGNWLDEFARGMSGAAHRFGMRLIGGDVSRHTSIVAALTVIGEVRTGRAMRRSGARPGDAIYVTGRLGAAEAGLGLLRRGGPTAIKRHARSYSLQRHLYPEPRLAIGEWLAREKLASAAMDLSDGVSTDLARLCEASGAGALLRSDAIPCAPDARSESPTPWQRLLLRALHGGEDYELLFTVPPRRAKRIPQTFHGVPITRIGEITSQRGVRLLDRAGRLRLLSAGGWDHFSRTTR